MPAPSLTSGSTQGSMPLQRHWIRLAEELTLSPVWDKDCKSLPVCQAGFGHQMSFGTNKDTPPSILQRFGNLGIANKGLQNSSVWHFKHG